MKILSKKIVFLVIMLVGIGLLSLLTTILHARLVREMRFVIQGEHDLLSMCVNPFNGKIFLGYDSEIHHYDGNLRNAGLIVPESDETILSLKTYLPPYNSSLTPAENRRRTNSPMVMVSSHFDFYLYNMTRPFKKHCSLDIFAASKPAYSKASGKIYLSDYQSFNLLVLNSNCEILQKLHVSEEFADDPVIDQVHNLIFQPFRSRAYVEVFQSVVDGVDHYVNSFSFPTMDVRNFGHHIVLASRQPRVDAVVMLFIGTNKVYSVSIPMEKIMSGIPFEIERDDWSLVYSMPIISLSCNCQIRIVPDAAYKRDYILSATYIGNDTSIDLQLIPYSNADRKERWSISGNFVRSNRVDGVVHPHNHCIYITYKDGHGDGIFKVCPRPNRP